MALSTAVPVALGASALASGGSGVLSLRHSQRGAGALAGFLFGAMLWSLALLGTMLVSSHHLAFLFHRSIFLAISIVAVSLFVFALRFCDRQDVISFRTLVVLLIEPTLFLGFLVTAPEYGLVWADVSRTTAGTFTTTLGPLFWAHIGYSALLALAGVAIMLRRAVQARGIDTTAFALVVLALVVPFVTAALDMLARRGLQFTPVAVSATGIALFVTLDRSNLMARAPIVRDALVEAVDDAMLAVDDDGRIVDHNSAFVTLVEKSNPRGNTVRDVLAEYPALAEAVHIRDERVVELDHTTGERFLEVSISPISDDAGNRLGDLVLFHDITDQQRQQRELERQNEQLDQFASFISHDLRNPLDVAIGRTTVIDELTDDPQLDEHVTKVQNAHQRMRKLIQDVLTLARQGQSIDEQHPVSVADVADRAWSHVETGEATLRVETDLTVRGDGDRLEQVFENLFRNSVEHGSTSSQAGPGDAVEHARTAPETDADATAPPDEASHRELTVWVADCGDSRGFFVADDGPGISVEEHDDVLDAGYTGDGDGSGLGLAIVASIAEAHDWTVRITESSEGGARLEFTGVEVVESEPVSSRTA